MPFLQNYGIAVKSYSKTGLLQTFPLFCNSPVLQDILCMAQNLLACRLELHPGEPFQVLDCKEDGHCTEYPCHGNGTAET